MDSEYIILAAVLMLVGVSGIILFNGPKTPAGDSCFCMIPSPEASAMQGTAGILLIFGVMFVPIGILKGGLPVKAEGSGSETMKSGRVYTPERLNSGAQIGLGLFLIIIGADALAIPSYLAFHSLDLILAGAVVAVLGVLLVARGIRRRKS